MKPLLALGTCAAVLLATGSRARAYEDLRFNPALDAALTGLGAATWLGTELLKRSLAPATCRWCNRNPDGGDGLSSVDSKMRSALRWSNTDRANTMSNLLAYSIVPAAAAGLEVLVAQRQGASGRDMVLDVLAVAEAAMLTGTVNQATKLAVGRERPFVHVLPPELKAKTGQPADNNLSFFSSHTSVSFSLVASAGTIAYLRGYRLAPWIWAVGVPLAATVGYLRMAADRHYFTDVAVGAAVGTAIGVSTPLLLHSRRSRVTVLPSLSGPLGLLLVGTF